MLSFTAERRDGLTGGPGLWGGSRVVGDRDIGLGLCRLTFLPGRGSLQVQGHQLGGRLQHKALVVDVKDVKGLGAGVAVDGRPGVAALNPLEGDGLCGEGDSQKDADAPGSKSIPQEHPPAGVTAPTPRPHTENVIQEAPKVTVSKVLVCRLLQELGHGHHEDSSLAKGPGRVSLGHCHLDVHPG